MSGYLYMSCILVDQKLELNMISLFKLVGYLCHDQHSHLVRCQFWGDSGFVRQLATNGLYNGLRPVFTESE